MNRKRAVSLNPHWCYLCGLVIPTNIVSGNHPLYGTIDHISAKSNGGSDSWRNKMPSHRICNEFKNSYIINSPLDFINVTHPRIIPLIFKASNIYLMEPEIEKAKHRAIKNWKLIFSNGLLSKDHLWNAVLDWENEGGCCYGR